MKPSPSQITEAKVTTPTVTQAMEVSSTQEGNCFFWAEYMLNFSQCSDVGEALSTYPILVQEEKAGYGRTARWIQSISSERKTSPIRLMLDPASIKQSDLKNLIETQKDAASNGARLGAQEANSSRRISYLQFSSPNSVRLKFKLYNAFPSSIEFINVDEENKQQLVVELICDELILEELSASEGILTKAKGSFSLLNYFPMETETGLKTHQSLQIRHVPNKSLMVTGEKVFLDLYELDFRYASSGFSFRTESWQPVSRDNHNLQADERGPAEPVDTTKSSAHFDADLTVAAREMQKEVERLHSGFGNRLEVLSFQSTLFKDFLGFYSDEGCSLQENVEALFLPLIFARSTSSMLSLWIGDDKNEATRKREVLKHYLEKPKTLGPQIFPVEKKLRYPEHFFKKSGDKMESLLWTRGQNMQTPVRLLLPNQKFFCGTLYNWAVSYSDFDETGDAQRAELQLQILGLHELNSDEETF